jgi:hypothetical protein
MMQEMGKTATGPGRTGLTRRVWGFSRRVQREMT